jgi:hypothetical protein
MKLVSPKALGFWCSKMSTCQKVSMQALFIFLGHAPRVRDAKEEEEEEEEEASSGSSKHIMHSTKIFEHILFFFFLFFSKGPVNKHVVTMKLISINKKISALINFEICQN